MIHVRLSKVQTDPVADTGGKNEGKLAPQQPVGGGKGRTHNGEIISHVRPDLFDLVVDDIVDAALGLELRHGRVGRREVEPLRAGLQVGLGGGWESNQIPMLRLGDKRVISVGDKRVALQCGTLTRMSFTTWLLSLCTLM